MKVIVIGPRGKMGKLITQVAASRDDMELIAGIAPKGRDYIGMDLGTVAMTGSEHIRKHWYAVLPDSPPKR